MRRGAWHPRDIHGLQGDCGEPNPLDDSGLWLLMCTVELGCVVEAGQASNGQP